MSKTEMLYNFDGCVILLKGRKQLARIVCVPKTDKEQSFVGIITDDKTKIILDSDNPANDEIRDLVVEPPKPQENK